MIVSNGWNLQRGDIRGVFLEADALDRKQGPLYSGLPPAGIPGVLDGAVILILGNIFGLNNDALQRWWKKFDAVMTSIGFFRSTFDVCVCTLRGTAGNRRESRVFMWTTQFVVDRVLCFPKLSQPCVIVPHSGSGKLLKECLWFQVYMNRTKTPKRS